MVWLEIMSFASFKGMRLLSEKYQKTILAVCAVSIMCFGLFFVIKSFMPP
jgi:hypothetical protein